MKIFLLLLLILLPLGAGVYLLYHQGPRDPIQVRQIDETRNPSSSSLTMVGTEGKRLFVVGETTSTLPDGTVTWPERYFWVESFQKQSDGTIQAKDVLMLLNPAPRRREDVKSLLLLNVNEDAMGRRAAMEDATRVRTHMRANEAEFLGGETLDNARRIGLRGDVLVAYVSRDRSRPPIKVQTTRADAEFENNRLGVLKLPEAFVVTDRFTTLEGVSLDVLSPTSGLKIGSNFHLKTYRSDPTPEMSPDLMIRSSGPAKFTPKFEDGQVPGDLFTALAFDAGQLALEHQVVVEAPGLVAKTEKLLADLQPRDAETTQPRFNNIRFEGGFDARVGPGTIRGKSAHVSFETTRVWHASVKTDTNPITLDWIPTGADKPLLSASCTGELDVHRGDGTTGWEKSHLLMRTNVAVRSGSLFGGFELFGEVLETTQTERSTPSRNNHPDRVFMEGKVRGQTAGFNFSSAAIEYTSTMDESGLISSETMILTGPAELRRIFDSTSEAGHEFFLSAREEIRVVKFPGLKPRLTFHARGETITERRSSAQKDQLLAGSIDCSFSTNELGQWTWVAFTAWKDVQGELANDSRFTADQLIGDNTSSSMILTGTPATFSRRSRPDEFLKAPEIHYRRGLGTIDAKGGVEGKYHLRDIVLFESTSPLPSSGPFASPAANAPVPWHISADSARFILVSAGSTKSTSLGLSEITLRGAIRLISPTKSLVGEHLHWNLFSGSGRAAGTPLRVNLKNPATPKDDLLECESMVISPGSSLLQGKPHLFATIVGSIDEDVLLPDEPNIETLSITCQRDILLRPGLVFFSGRAILVRGDPETRGLQLESDTATARFALDESGRPTTKLEKIEGYDNVVFRTGKLSGSGDVLEFDYLKRQVTVRSVANPCRLDFAGLVRENSSALRFDLKNSRFVTYDAQGSGFLKRE